MKAASTTVETSLAPWAELQRIFPYNSKHFSLPQIAQAFPAIFETKRYAMENFIRFGVVRDPKSWIVSWFNYRSREQLADPAHGQHDQYCGAMSFRDFAEEVVKPSPRPFGYVRPQHELLTADGQLACNFVIESRSFTQDLLEIVGIMKVPVPDERFIKVRNKTERIRITPEEVDWDAVPGLMAFLARDFALYDACMAYRRGQSEVCRALVGRGEAFPYDPAEVEALLRLYWKSAVASHRHGPTKGVTEAELEAELSALDQDEALREVLNAQLA